MPGVVWWSGMVAVVLAIIAVTLAVLPALAVLVTLGLAAGIVTARARREALAALALVGVVSAIMAGWLWRAGFQQADANLPPSPWTDLWWPLAAIAAGSLMTFAAVYAKQLRDVHDRQQ